MGPKKRKGAQAQEEDGGRGKRTKKPNTKFALIESDGEEDVGIVAQAKKKNSPDKSVKSKKNSKPDSVLHPDACLVCRELKSKEDKQNKMIGCDKCDKWFHWSCVGMTKKTQPKKNADWFCEKCKVQVSNGSSRKAEEGPKQSTWQTPAQRKVYDGPPTVNSGKAKEYSIGPPDTSSKKNGRKLPVKKGSDKDLENNAVATTNTPSKAGLREFLGGEETNEESTPASTEDTDDEAPPSPGIIGESIKHSLTSPKSKVKTNTSDEPPLAPGMIGECATQNQISPNDKGKTSTRKPNIKSPGFKSTLVPVITNNSRKSSSDDPYSILDNDIALEAASDLPASQILEALPNQILSTKRAPGITGTKKAPAITGTKKEPRSEILDGLHVTSIASTTNSSATIRRESSFDDTMPSDHTNSISSSQRKTNVSNSTLAHVIQSGIPLSTSYSQSLINRGEQTYEPKSLLGLPLSITKPQNSLVGLPISIMKSPAAAPVPAFIENLPISSNPPHSQSPPSPNKTYEMESSQGSKIVQVPQSIPLVISSNTNITTTRPRFLVAGPRQPLVRPGVHLLRPGQQVVRIRMAGTRPELQGSRADFQGGRPSLPATRPRMVIIRTSGSITRANLPVAGATVQLANPGVPILRPGLQMVGPNLTSVRIIRPTTAPASAPISNLTQEEDVVMVRDKALDDLPRDLVKLIKVSEPKGLDDKDSDSDGRKTAEDDFMGMFDDETRKLAESFDMFDAAHQSDANSLKSDEEKEAVRVQVQSPLAGPQSSPVTSPDVPVAEPESPGTPGTPRLMICTPGGSTPSLAARHVLPVRPSLGASPTLGTPRLPGQMVRLRGMRTRGGVMVRMRGGPGIRPRMPVRLLSPRAQRPGLAPRMRGAPSMRPGALGMRPGALGMRPGAPGMRPGAPGMRPRPPLRLAMSGSVETRPGMSPRAGGPRTNLGPRQPAPVIEAPAQAAEDEIVLTKDTTPVHPKKEAAELIELDDHDSPPLKPRSKAMDRLSHLGISVSRKRGEGSSHRTLPTVVAQSPSVSRPAAKKKVELELSEEQIQALKALGMM